MEGGVGEEGEKEEEEKERGSDDDSGCSGSGEAGSPRQPPAPVSAGRHPPYPPGPVEARSGGGGGGGGRAGVPARLGAAGLRGGGGGGGGGLGYEFRPDGEGYYLYELAPLAGRESYTLDGLPAGSFAAYYVKEADGTLRMFLRTRVKPAQFVGPAKPVDYPAMLGRADPGGRGRLLEEWNRGRMVKVLGDGSIRLPHAFRLTASFRVRRMYDYFYVTHQWQDMQRLLATLEPGMMFVVWVTQHRDVKHRLQERYERVQKDDRAVNFAVGGDPMVKALQQKLAEPALYVLDVKIHYAWAKRELTRLSFFRVKEVEELKRVCEAFASSFNHAALTYTLRVNKLKPASTSKANGGGGLRAPKSLEAEIDRPPSLDRYRLLVGAPSRFIHGLHDIVMNVKDTLAAVVVPDPALHRVQLERAQEVPLGRPLTGDIRVGSVPGRVDAPVSLSWDQVNAHVYLLGATRSGKSNLFKVLVKNIAETRAAGGGMKPVVFVIDPSGKHADELAAYFEGRGHPNYVYFHPVDSPIGFNPLDLPPAEKPEVAELQMLSHTKEVMETAFRLVREATYAHALVLGAIATLLRVKRDGTITFTDVASMLEGFKLRVYRPMVEDPEVTNRIALLSHLEETSYLSALARLELVAHNILLRRIMGENTIPYDELLKPGRVYLINASETVLGSTENFYVLASTIIFHVWVAATYYHSLGRKTPHVYIFVDEYQKLRELHLVDRILSEGLKYGVHLVLAHQHLGQIDEAQRRSIFNNCAVKVFFRVAGDDAEAAASLDPEYAEQLSKEIPNLPVGQAYLLLSQTKPDEVRLPPIRVKIDFYPELEPSQHEIDEVKGRVVEKMKKYRPSEPGEDVFVNIDPITHFALSDGEYSYPVVRERYTLALIYAATKNAGYTTAKELLPMLRTDYAHLIPLLTELYAQGRIGFRSQRVEAAASGGAEALAAALRREGIVYRSGIFEPLRSAEFAGETVRSPEGLSLAEKAWTAYWTSDYALIRVRQRPGRGERRPDFIAVKIVAGPKGLVLDRANPIAVEIETANEVIRNPEQVYRNMTKWGASTFREIHIYAPDTPEVRRKLEELRGRVDDPELRECITIVYVKLEAGGGGARREGAPPVGSDADGEPDVDMDMGVSAPAEETPPSPTPTPTPSPSPSPAQPAEPTPLEPDTAEEHRESTGGEEEEGVEGGETGEGEEEDVEPNGEEEKEGVNLDDFFNG